MENSRPCGDIHVINHLSFGLKYVIFFRRVGDYFRADSWFSV